MSDKVNNPPHYNKGDIECIDAIRASMSADEFAGYCKGNLIKYTWRYGYKGGLEDLKKAQWYLKRLVETVGKAPTSEEIPDARDPQYSSYISTLKAYPVRGHGGVQWSNEKKTRVNCGYVDCPRCLEDM